MRRFGPSPSWAFVVALAACSGHGANTVAVAPAAPVTINAALASSPPAEAPAEAAAPELGTSSPEANDAPGVDSAGHEPAPEAAEHGWLGVELEPPGTGDAGVRIARVVPHSPADQAGLVAGDLIVRIDNDAVAAPPDVVAIVTSKPAGTRVAVMLKRGNADRLIAVTLSARASRDEVLRMSFVDQPAPPLDGLHLAKGSLVPTLAAQRGHVLLIEFWAASCMPCRALIPHMNQLHAQYAVRGLSVLGVTLDPVPRAAQAATDLGMDYPIASDESERTSRAYQADATPMLFVLDRSGTVRDVIVGYDAPRLAKLDRLVDQLLKER